MSNILVLRIFKGVELKQVKQFTRFPVVVGRPTAEVDLALDDDSVSPIHCLFDLRKDTIFICDLGSQTGTLKNGKPVLDEAVRNEDTVTIGAFKIQAFIASSAKPDLIMISESESRQKSSINLPERNKLPGYGNQLPKEMMAPENVLGKQTTLSSNKIRRKKETFAPPNQISELKSYLRPATGNNIQVFFAWKDRILNVYHFAKKDKIILWRFFADFSLDWKLLGIKSSDPFLKQTAGGVTLFIPFGFDIQLVTPTSRFDENTLRTLKRLHPVQMGSSLTLSGGELLEMVHPGFNLQILVRRIGETDKARPVGLLDLSSGEVAGVVFSLIIVILMAFMISVYAPEPGVEFSGEETGRYAEFIYVPPPLPQPEKEEARDVVKPQQLEPKPPEPVKVVVKEEKIPPKASPVPASNKKNEMLPNVDKQTAKPSPRQEPEGSSKSHSQSVSLPKKEKKEVGGAGFAPGSKEAASTAQKKIDINQVGLIGAFGGGGSRSSVDKVSVGTGDILGRASEVTGKIGSGGSSPGDEVGARLIKNPKGIGGTVKEPINRIAPSGRGKMSDLLEGPGGSGTSRVQVQVEAPGMPVEFTGTIDREAVRRVIRSIINQIKTCYERRLQLRPGLHGKVTIVFEIGERGRVLSARAKKSTLPDEQVALCVSERIKEQKFPEPARGTIAVVEYPFVFDAQK
ncbi:MAG: AgmX/PglI C-terminal domain-containing protein [Pseudobdellovibrionaceae bacterium]|nr:AgmX/PglI C-terminal domain-containing protein [Pseudobdellovibrionaceae bacterium]